ncbi:C39 family peptidase [Lentilactobacillus sp. Marseille-Q4993]|uniref:C39 family peptidase n=1 Tax=Lentilactobacillus sp. Marseille-Q4993 TaxID=3039492 RepID=UPI0024BD0B5C|nr:C39 family peptidase [Lentilactobacillus sp. Marseille-Q4993]
MKFRVIFAAFIAWACLAVPQALASSKPTPTVSYYVTLKPSANKYDVLTSLTDDPNVENQTENTYAGKTVHVYREQVKDGVTYEKFTYNHHVVGWLNDNALGHTYRKLSVKMVGQRPQLPTGCEITATTMMLNYAGDNSTKFELAREMPRSSNPNKGFVGNPYSKSGWWIYPKGLTKLVKHHLGSSIDMTGDSFSQIKDQINDNKPVVVWVAGVDGFVNHALTVTGYSKTRVYYNDPWTKKKTSMSIKAFHQHRKADKYRALGY